jgi:hypothetical protein
MLRLDKVIKMRKAAAALNDHINLYAFWNKTTFLTKSGDLGIVRAKGLWPGLRCLSISFQIQSAGYRRIGKSQNGASHRKNIDTPPLKGSRLEPGWFHLR